MFSSLRSRLWLSYALVISAALGVVSLVLVFYIIRNPLIYRQEAARLLVVQSILLNDREKLSELPPDALKTFITDLAETYGVRISIYKGSRQLLADSGEKEVPALRLPRLSRLRLSGSMRDSEGRAWFYLVRAMDDGKWLMVSTARPAVPLLTILKDDLLLPILGAGITALLLSLLLAFLLSRWVGDPLQRVIVASRGMPEFEAVPVEAEGPREVQELIHVFNDMSSRITSSQQSQRRFVANVSHELKTPITVIQGFSQAILDGTADSPESERQAAQAIYDESGRMHRLVLDLLDLARLDAGTMVLKKESVNIGLLLQHIVDRFTMQAQRTGISLELSAPPLPNILGDSDRLVQVFSNLMENSLKFTPEGGQITIVASSDSSQLRVDVVDTGEGISQDALPHIFDRFYQADPSRKGGNTHGSGLGLAIAREIVNAHHGTITAQSSPGQGSTFTVRLPLALPDASTITRRRKS